jgi:hypothetical protein
VERIYYAGAAENLWEPYAIGFLQWSAEKWIDQPEPSFAANEEWEHERRQMEDVVRHRI